MSDHSPDRCLARAVTPERKLRDRALQESRDARQDWDSDRAECGRGSYLPFDLRVRLLSTACNNDVGRGK